MGLTHDLSEADMNDLLAGGIYGHLGCLLPDGRVYVVPVTYAYHDGHVYGFTTEGQKVEAMRAHPSVCIQVESPLTEGVWNSVIAWGEYEELSGKNRASAIQIISRRLDAAHGEGISPLYRSPDDIGGKHAVLYRIRIERKTGKHVQYD